jgi:catechol 2,3-dioxygenase-like lactoylglutathione lyase family enzyme
MLKDASVNPTLPCSDLERAKRFYAEKLGLNPSSENPGGAFYDHAGGTQFLLFPSSGRASGTHTQMGFSVKDIEAQVGELTSRGVEFEVADVPGFDKQTHIAHTGEVRAAWFKDSEGNLLGLVQQPA